MLEMFGTAPFVTQAAELVLDDREGKGHMITQLCTGGSLKNRVESERFLLPSLAAKHLQTLANLLWLVMLKVCFLLPSRSCTVHTLALTSKLLDANNIRTAARCTRYRDCPATSGIFFHYAGLLHNDLKPSNIMLENKTPESGIKVADFGLARREAQFRHVTDGEPYGTPGFMAPEVAEFGLCSKRSDMYSLGGVLYFMLNGETHFRTGTSM